MRPNFVLGTKFCSFQIIFSSATKRVSTATKNVSTARKKDVQGDERNLRVQKKNVLSHLGSVSHFFKNSGKSPMGLMMLLFNLAIEAE